MKRRDFLSHTSKALIGLGAASAFPWSQAWAANVSNDHRLLVLRFNGAWDVMMAMDGHDLSDLAALQLDETDVYRIEARIPTEKHKTALLGPALNPLKPYINEIAIINGMLMLPEDSVHESNRSFMASGMVGSDAIFAPFAIAKKLQSQSSLLSKQVAYRMEYEQVLSGGYAFTIPTSELEKIEANLRASAEDAEMASMRRKKGTLTKAILNNRSEEAINQKTLAMLKQLQENDQNVEPSEQEVEDGEIGFPSFVNPTLAALSSGKIQFAQLDFVDDGSLDTHSGHATSHLPNLSQGFLWLARVIESMKKLEVSPGVSLYDKTTVVITSEFSRTPWQEGTDGTSHNQFNNSALILGRGVRGGQVVGKSHIFTKAQTNQGNSVLAASPFDFSKERPLDKAEILKLNKGELGIALPDDRYVDYITPEVLWRTVGAMMGATGIRDLGQGPILKSILKS